MDFYVSIQNQRPIVIDFAGFEFPAFYDKPYNDGATLNTIVNNMSLDGSKYE